MAIPRGTAKWRAHNNTPMPKSLMTAEQKKEFLFEVAQGKGIYRTLGAMKLGKGTLVNTLEDDRTFAEQYKIAIETPKEMLEEFVLANGLQDPMIALKVLDRIDCIRIAHQKRRDDHATRQLAASALGGPPEAQGKIDLKRLSKEKLKTLKSILDEARVPEATENVDGEPKQPGKP